MKTKRFTALLISILMILQMFVISTSAAYIEQAEDPEPDPEIVTSGTCGENAAWELDSDGVLTISGTGAMYDYYGNKPWQQYSSSISSIVIEDGVMAIGAGVFSNSRLARTSIIIPDSVTSIGKGAFANCSGLTSIMIPDNVTYIGDGAFSMCYSLSNINVDPANEYYQSIDGVLYSKDGKRILAYPGGKAGSYNITDSVTYLGNSAFSGCSSLTRITIPDSVTYVGDYAFDGCQSLTSITIPDGVAYIGDSAFRGCKSLTSISIPDGVINIRSFTFENCSSLISITIPNGVTRISDYAFNGCQSLTNITIPDTVKSIGRTAFLNCSSLTSITISDSVTSIGDGAFSGCDSLSNIYVDPANEYYQTIDGILFSKDGKELIAYPRDVGGGYNIPDSVTRIGAYAFNGCSNLTSITIPDGVTSIDSSTFKGCSSLISITIPDSVTYIGWSAFENCNSLAAITIPDGVTSIDDFAFYLCSSLTSITIPDSVTYVGWSAFYGCDSLVTITIPAEVTCLDVYTFAWCSNLKYALFKGDAPFLLSSVFHEVASDFTIYYYEGATGWTTPTWTAYDGSVYNTCMIPNPTAANVIGTVTSMDSDPASEEDDMITITLTNDDNVYSTTVVSTNENGIADYKIEGVAAGTYTMTVSKAGHVTEQYTVVVNGENVKQNVAIYLLGDANHDGKSDSSDAVAILRNLAGYDVTNFHEQTADFNGDGKADSSDAVAILRKLAGY